MHKQHGFGHVWLLLIVVLIAAVGFLAFKKVSNPLGLAACSATPLSVSPLSSKDYLGILPLGNAGPPDHTLPTDHIYMILPQDDSTTKTVPVRAPGDIRITGISRSDYYTSSGSLRNSDFELSFAVCKNVKGYFAHMSSLTPALAAKAPADSKNCQSYATPDGNSGAARQSSCGFSLNMKFSAGEVIGTGGGPLTKSAAVDFGLIDTRITNNFANNKRYTAEEHLHGVCPVDYFTSAVKSQLDARFGSASLRRIIQPVCGQFNQDKLGTLQGNWFIGADAQDTPPYWQKELAVVHDNLNPLEGVISVGGSIGQPGAWVFKPLAGGSYNREPSSVTPGNTIYCYDSDAALENNRQKTDSRILLRLTSTTSLTAEEQAGKCGSSSQFTPAAKTYSR